MSDLKRYLIAVVLSVFAGAQAENSVAQKSLQTKDTNQTVSDKYYLYDEATDTYLKKIIDQSLKLIKKGDPNEAIMLLVKEQARLDKMGRKVNLVPGGKYVKDKNGLIIRMPEEAKTDLPIVDKNSIPRAPAPLVVSLMTIRTSHGQCPLEMLEYYKGLVKNYKGNESSILAASQLISILGFQNSKSWEFIEATFEQQEKNLLSQMFIRDYLSDRDQKTKITKENLVISLKKLSPEKVPDNIQQMYTHLDRLRQGVIEALFWEECPKWTEFNIENRYKQALRFRNNKEYEKAISLYVSVAERYKDNKEIYYKAKLLSLETDMESVFVANQGYNAFGKILESYQELLNSGTSEATRAKMFRALCNIYMEQNDLALKTINDDSLTSESFLTFTYLFEKLSSEQRKKFDEFCWLHCNLWHDYNFSRQYVYAIEMYKQGEYAESIKYFDRLSERYRDKLASEQVLANVKSAIRLGNADMTVTLLKKCGDVKQSQSLLSSDIVWLIQNGEIRCALSIIDSIKFLLKEAPMSAELTFYNAYALLLEGRDEACSKVCQEMKTLYPQSLYVVKIHYMLEQKKTLLAAFKNTQKDKFNDLINKASKCFDNGELEMALGIYLRIFAEYADKTEESSKACYLLGYYYLLSGDFSKANDILSFLQKEYKNSTYAKEADALIKRIKDLTAS